MKLESFWTDTVIPFEGCRDPLPAKADVVVVGSGFTGLPAIGAYYRLKDKLA